MPAFLLVQWDGTTSRDGGQDAKDAAQGSYEVTFARPVGARLRREPSRQISLQGTKPVRVEGSDRTLTEDATIISVKRTV